MTMRRFALVFGVVGLLAAAALPAKAASNEPWTSFYGGAHAGYGWADVSGWDNLFNADIGSATASGWIFGGQLGYDLQMANWVLGAQVSLAAADLTGSHLFLDGTGPTDRVHYDIKYLGTLSGRIGYTVTPDALVYLKGGGAWARTNYEDSDPAPLFGFPPYTGSTEDSRLGWLVGLGLEYRMLKHLSLYAEYQHMGFGDSDVTIVYSDGVIGYYSFSQSIDSVILGLNYRFYGPGQGGPQ